MPGLDELRPQRVVGGDAVHGGRDRVRVLGVEQESGIAQGLGDRGRRVRDDRDAMVHGFEQRDAEALVLARHHVDVGGLRSTRSARPR